MLVGDSRQIAAADIGKLFARLQDAGMKIPTMDEIMRQRDAALKAAVDASR